MLLPSALTCDSSHSPPLTRLQSALFASPPASPPQLSTQSAVGNIFSTCRSLQSLLTSPMPPVNATSSATEPITPPTSFHAQLPTPPLAHASAPPLKLRLRSRKTDTAGHSADPTAPARKRIVKRAPAPPSRGPNKRRRAVEEDEEDNSDMEQTEQPRNTRSAQINNETATTVDEREAEEIDVDPPLTPKRARIAPEVIPLGLERSDYHSLHAKGLLISSENEKENQGNRGTDVVVEADGEEWSTEDDRILVELVLEKLKLSKSEWQDCARSLGKDRNSLGRRWKSLIINGEVGLKRNGLRRGKIHGTWR
ncbi:hypothetical protein QBC43DRAFT_321592 [Cladorrhinum sp. PSN259]|nr:hypothetical protein QBC43DRAFT_321592 [Cladorrhinum sp. PSN259]